jgi:hypothetical protein
MLQGSRTVTRITYCELGEALSSRSFSQGEHGSTTLCERQSESSGSMPFSSLNRVRLDRQMVARGAWQQWTELPEGARCEPRRHDFTYPSKPPRTFQAKRNSSVRRSASPCAARPRVLALLGTPRVISLGCGQLEDGVPHAEALSPANRNHKPHGLSSRTRAKGREPLAGSALASTPQIPPM